ESARRCHPTRRAPRRPVNREPVGPAASAFLVHFGVRPSVMEQNRRCGPKRSEPPNVGERPAGTIRIVADPIKPNQSGLPSPKLAQAVRDTAKDFAKEAIFEKRPYLKLAFSNPYNLSLLGGALAASVLTLNPILALGAIGAE